MGKLTTREEINWFAQQMEIQLRANDHKGGWRDCSVDELLQRINDEYLELLDAMVDNPKDIHAIVVECADVANFAMMVADVVYRYGVQITHGQP